MDIIIADDHSLIGEAIHNFFQNNAPEFKVHVAINKPEVISILQARNISLIIQDVQFGDIDAREYITEIKKITPGLKIMALSSNVDAYTIRSVLASGANSYLSKTSPLKEILRGVKETMSNQQFLSPDVKKALENRINNNDIIHLTRREKEVLNGIQDGLSTKEIATVLFLSQKTIEGYRSSLLIKFDVKNVAGLVKKAILHGFV